MVIVELTKNITLTTKTVFNMINNFNFHGNIYLNFGCKKCNQGGNNTGCGSYVNSVTLDFETAVYTN